MIINGNALNIPLSDNSVQMVCTSPPYWGLRSYLGTDDPNKAMELGLEPTPDCGRPMMKLRSDLTDKEYQFVISRLKELGLI